MIDLIVPTIPGREASLERCLDSFERLTRVPYDEIVIRDSETCGAGWKAGIEAGDGDFVALVADDLEVVSDHWADRCIEAAEAGLLPCPRVFRPDGSIESQGGDMALMHHLRRNPTRDGTPVNFTTVPFASRAQIEAIGMLDTQYGCDVWVSHQGRKLGFETVLCHGYDLVHHQEMIGRGAGMNQAERDAMDMKTVREALAA